MKWKFIQLPLAATFLFAANLVGAGTCNDPPPVSSSGFTISGYDPVTATTTSTSTTLTGGCTKSGGNADTYTVGAGQGLNFSGGSNRAKSGANFINYSVTTDIGCSMIWNGTNTFLFSFTSNVSQSPTYFGCMPAGQYVAALTYQDTVTMTTNHGGLLSSNTFPVSITVASRCKLSSAPGAIAFTYTAFGAAAPPSNTSFGIICNQSLPFSADVGGGATGSGVVSGLNYSLGINTSGSGGTNPLSSTGIGATQTFFINGTMAAGQAGCTGGTCSPTDPRTLTITY